MTELHTRKGRSDGEKQFIVDSPNGSRSIAMDGGGGDD